MITGFSVTTLLLGINELDCAKLLGSCGCTSGHLDVEPRCVIDFEVLHHQSGCTEDTLSRVECPPRLVKNGERPERVEEVSWSGDIEFL